MSVYLALQVAGAYPDNVAITRCRLLPHIFTLTSEEAVIFCYTIHKLTPICAFHSAMLYPVRTFLPHPKMAAIECSTQDAKL